MFDSQVYIPLVTSVLPVRFEMDYHWNADQYQFLEVIDFEIEGHRVPGGLEISFGDNDLVYTIARLNDGRIVLKRWAGDPELSLSEVVLDRLPQRGDRVTGEYRMFPQDSKYLPRLLEDLQRHMERTDKDLFYPAYVVIERVVQHHPDYKGDW
jgi:hypothetical protein